MTDGPGLARCWKCKRPLTDPESRALGVGPVCRGKMTGKDWRDLGQERDGLATLVGDPEGRQEDDVSVENYVLLSEVRMDGGTQPRVEIDQATVDAYAEDMQNGDEFPPVVVFDDGKDRWLADGFHRVLAATRLEMEALPADVRKGTRRDAILYSVGANATHGLRRSNADKRAAVEKLLRDEEWVQWSDREIARVCGVSHTLVRTVRSELELTGIISSEAERTYKTRHGTTATMDTSAIGQSQPTGSPEEASAGETGEAPAPVRVDVQIYDSEDIDDIAYESYEIPGEMADHWWLAYQAIADEYPESLVFAEMRRGSKRAYWTLGKSADVAEQVLSNAGRDYYFAGRTSTPGGSVLIVACPAAPFFADALPTLLETGYMVVTSALVQDYELLSAAPAVSDALTQNYERLGQEAASPDETEDTGDSREPPAWVRDGSLVPPDSTPPVPATPPIPGLPVDRADREHLEGVVDYDDPLLEHIIEMEFRLDRFFEALNDAAGEIEEGTPDRAILAHFEGVAKHGVRPIYEMIHNLIPEGALDGLREEMAAAEPDRWRGVISDYLWKLRRTLPSEVSEPVLPAKQFGLFGGDAEEPAAR